MSTSDGSSKPRFTDMIKSAMTPRPLSIDPDAPNPVPKSLKWAGGLITASGALNLIFGAYAALFRQSIVDSSVDLYRAAIDTCNNNGTGIGTAVTSTENTDAVNQCKSLVPLTQDMVNNALSGTLLIGVLLTVIGIGTIIAGVGVFKGAVWARRLATPLGALLMIGTFLGLLSTLPAFASTLLVVVGLALTYVGKGANYFIRAKAKGKK